MDKNKLYYLVGLAGSGKTTMCKQLADSVSGGVAIQVSGRFMALIKENGIKSPDILDSITTGVRENLINKLHHEFEVDKVGNAYTFLDGHMLVENRVSSQRVNAMATENNGISSGLIFLNTPSDFILNNIREDNVSGIRKRKRSSVTELRNIAEYEFQAAEDYCIKNEIEFGVLNNLQLSAGVSKLFDQDIRFLNDYYLSTDSELRKEYKEQFSSELKPSVLRKKHYNIGRMMLDYFLKKEDFEGKGYQVLAVPRSGACIAGGFTSNFNGKLLMSKVPSEVSSEIDISQPLIIIDSVIDSGSTICNIIKEIPYSYKQPIHVICLAINIKALDLIESFGNRVSFHCLGFSNKEVRPAGEMDMGARLFGTES
jgi:energy-coupling factor transporter ATP-binding protein EcfA2